MYSAKTWLDIVIQGIAPEISVWSRRHVGYRIFLQWTCHYCKKLIDEYDFDYVSAYVYICL